MGAIVRPDSWEGLDTAVRQARIEGAADPGRRYARELLESEDPGEPDLVSVVVPVRGALDPLVTDAALASITGQRGVRIQLVVSEQCRGPEHFRATAARHGATYVLDRLPPGQEGRHFHAGRIRNMGIRAARGAFVYLTDADHLLVDPHYLARLLTVMRAHPDLVLTDIRMRRLVAGARAACTAFLEQGRWPPPGLRELAPFILACGPLPSARRRRYVHVVRQGRGYVAEAEALLQAARGGGAALGYAGALRSCRASGAVFARRSQLDAVAGYGERFLDWGNDDLDLKWKLTQLFCVASLERIADLEVVHVDHRRGPRDLLGCERNNLLAEARRAAGGLATILSDLLTQRSPYGVELRARVRVRIGPPAFPIDPAPEAPAPFRTARAVAAP